MTTSQDAGDEEFSGDDEEFSGHVADRLIGSILSSLDSGGLTSAVDAVAELLEEATSRSAP
ncbi:MAG: hypothetical protein JOY82_07550 [Streptosporangiaceae bacterium]|nr:hypothetical protein [Streptosporangiaceae bacterium]MBV9854368.1 hypothetical protein [Streptosporangiaceae bacterium]